MADFNITDTTSKYSYLGAGMTSLTGFIANTFGNINWADVASITGIIIGVATFLVNWYYKKKDFELKKLEIEDKINDKKSR
jgi:hypothetical protein